MVLCDSCKTIKIFFVLKSCFLNYIRSENYYLCMMKLLALSISYIILCDAVVAQVKLPRLISDSMILQRDTKVKIWGWASADEKVTINFYNKTSTTTTGKDGKWMITLAPMKGGGTL